MATGKVLNGNPHAGNPHVRFDEGKVASVATPRRVSRLYTKKPMILLFAALAVAFGARAATETVGGCTWEYQINDDMAEILV